MLRFIGAVVIILLILGPLMERAGMLPGGILHDLVELEVRAFETCVAWITNLVNGRRL